MLVVGPVTATASPATSSAGVTEYYDGQVFTLTPTNWHGATDCAIVTPTVAYCFSSNQAFNEFTPSSVGYTPAVTPDCNGTTDICKCNGAAKIWDGADFTDTGLAFYDYGYQQDLSSYTTTPFNIVSWFTDGQRDYSPMTDCTADAYTPGNLSMGSDAEATNLGSNHQEVDYIELTHT